MDLEELINSEEPKTIVKSIMLSNILSHEDKKKLFIALREGTVADLMPSGRAYKANISAKSIPYDDFMNAVKETGMELLITYMRFIYDYYPGNREAIKEKFKSIVRERFGSLEYSTSTGYDSVDNIEIFKKKLHCIRMENEGHPEEIYKDIQKELAYVVDTKVLSSGQAKKLLEEILPEYSSMAIEYLQQNLLGRDGRGVVGKDASIGARAIESGAQAVKGDNAASDNAYLSSEHQSHSSGVDTNNYATNVDTTFTGRGGDGDTRHSNVTNTINNSGGSAIVDDRDAIFYQLNGVMSYWDIQQLINETKKHFHQEMMACTSNADKDTKDKVEKLHSYMEDFSHCDLGMENNNVSAQGDMESDVKANDEPDNAKTEMRKADTTTESQVTHVKNDGKKPLEITEEILTMIGEVMDAIMSKLPKNPMEAFDIIFKGNSLSNCDPKVSEVIEREGVASQYNRLIPIMKELSSNYAQSIDMYNDLNSKYILDNYVKVAAANRTLEQDEMDDAPVLTMNWNKGND